MRPILRPLWATPGLLAKLVLVVVIAVAAVAGLGRASRARTFARLAAWDKGRSTTQPARGKD